MGNVAPPLGPARRGATDEKEDGMDQDKKQPSRDIGLDARRAQGDRSLQPPTPDVDERSYDTKAGDPDVKVKNVIDDTEFRSGQGPLGSGD